ncbi:MAG TPA: DNA starvation/stationary phase protection protein Dps [Vicinamibacterales bacterium]|jgi:starvation-inducible DNA-binding protein
MYRTKNDLPENLRATVGHEMNTTLAGLIDLQLQAKNAHWNLKGQNFIALHELFDQIVAAVQGYADLIAERIVQLGGVAEGTLQSVAKASQLSPYPQNIGDWNHHVEALSAAIAYVGEQAREGIEKTDGLGDRDTADILTEISRGLDKWLWFVEAHLQTESARETRGSRQVEAKSGRRR